MWPIASDVAHNIVCVYVTNRCCTKMAYPIEMPFGADSRGANKPCIRWESRSPQEQAFWRNTHARKCLLPRKMLPFVKLLWTLVMDGHPSFHPPNSVKSVKKSTNHWPQLGPGAMGSFFICHCIPDTTDVATCTPSLLYAITLTPVPGKKTNRKILLHRLTSIAWELCPFTVIKAILTWQ